MRYPRNSTALGSHSSQNCQASRGGRIVANNKAPHSEEPQDAGAGTMTYELLGAPACNRVLPISTVVRELTFGRFITLADTSAAPTTALRMRSSALTMPLSMIDMALASSAPEPPSVLDAAEKALALPNGAGSEKAKDPATNGKSLDGPRYSI